MADKTPIPAAKKSDSEDVSWALSTAEAMWNRGDHADAVKWIRKAVEAASEAEDDDRALELAKAAADLASSAGIIPTAPPPPVAPVARPSAPAPRPPVPPPPVSSRPELPTAARSSGRPPALPAAANAGAPRAPAQARVAPTAQPRAQAVPGGGKAPIPAVRPAAGVPAKPAGRTGRKSQANLNEEAKRAAALVAEAARVTEAARVAPLPAGPPPLPPSVASGEVTITQALPDEITQQIQLGHQATGEPRRRARASRPAHEEIAHEVVHAPVTATTDEMDAWPTQSLVGDGFSDADEQTRVGEPAYQENMDNAVASEPPPKHAPPELRASQAIRVVVWRAADGVRVAPYGTAVNAIGVDALLVALDPNADLATWLSRK